jgi:hypothetical protein
MLLCLPDAPQASLQQSRSEAEPACADWAARARRHAQRARARAAGRSR